MLKRAFFGIFKAAFWTINKRMYKVRHIYRKMRTTILRVRRKIDEEFKDVHIWGNGINLNDQIEYFYGRHRSGWGYALSSLEALHNKDAIYFDSFIERTFAWELTPHRTHRYDWIGCVHVPPMIPDFLSGYIRNQCFDKIQETENWKNSERHCCGFIVLSNYLADYLRKKTSLPISVLYHPTEIPAQQWSIDLFRRNQHKKIVQVGWWLRSLCAIYELPESQYTKINLKLGRWFKDVFEAEKNRRKKMGMFQDWMLKTAETVSFLPNKEYDRLLSENIVFLNLYDSSANNTVIECIARGTPLLVNKLPAVVEYLGDEYPLYYETYEEAVAKAENYQLLYTASEYMKQTERREHLSRRHFLESFLKSEVYKVTQTKRI